jgi:hypothetical protein
MALFGAEFFPPEKSKNPLPGENLLHKPEIILQFRHFSRFGYRHFHLPSGSQSDEYIPGVLLRVGDLIFRERFLVLK